MRGKEKGKDETEPYWPGIFVNYKRPADRRKNEAPAFWVIRASNPGGDYQQTPIKESGWYTLGMSFTGDGMIHYYIHKGGEDLTAADRVASQFPVQLSMLVLHRRLLRLFGSNDGQNWTTGWVIDDPAVFLAYPPRALHARASTFEGQAEAAGHTLARATTNRPGRCGPCLFATGE